MKKKSLFDRIPDFATPQEVEVALSQVMSNSVQKFSNDEVMDALCELAGVHRDSYAHLNEFQVSRLEKFVYSLWNRESVASTQKFIEIVEAFELQNAYEMACRLACSIADSDSRAELEEAIEEIGPSVRG